MFATRDCVLVLSPQKPIYTPKTIWKKHIFLKGRPSYCPVTKKKKSFNFPILRTKITFWNDGVKKQKNKKRTIAGSCLLSLNAVFFLRDLSVHRTSTLPSGTQLDLKYEMESCCLQGHLSVWLSCGFVKREHLSQVLKRESPSLATFCLLCLSENGKAATNSAVSWLSRSGVEPFAQLKECFRCGCGENWQRKFRDAVECLSSTKSIHERLKAN